MNAGRSCPLSYRYVPSCFRTATRTDTDTLYVVGGLYGNGPALDAVLALFGAEPGRKRLIFNGDFNWFDIASEHFERINETVLGFDAIRGNVETELAPRTPGGTATGCGCAYPEWVDDAVVARSNAIMDRLTETASGFPHIHERLAALPMWTRIDVGGVPVGVVHGDAQSLAGWGFAPEHLREERYREQARAWLDVSDMRIFASSHTCSPALLSLADKAGRACAIANNGAAGMPNFSGSLYGVLTRISVTPHTGARLYGVRIDHVHVDALPIRYDCARWHAEFLAQWPEGTPAHASYWQRIIQGPMTTLSDARIDMCRERSASCPS